MVKTLFESIDLDLPFKLAESQLHVAVPSGAARLRSSVVSNTVYDSRMPDEAFIDLGNGVAISGPELLFVEFAGSMRLIEHLMLGHELCGSFSRDAQSPYDGSIAYGVKPLTSVERIKGFLEGAKHVRGIEKARVSLQYLNDNAWSPTESLVAALLRLPIDDFGYEMGPLVLNKRFDAACELPGAKASRVPDVLFEGTPIGVNYDGLVHLDMKPIVKAAMDVGAHPGTAKTDAALISALESVRAKAVDDIRRNRELAIDGLSVFPVVKEDLYTPGGFDQIAAQLMDMLEKQSGFDMSYQKRALKGKALSKARYRTMLSLLPGRHERNVQVGRFIAGNKVCDGPGEVHECWIEL